MITRSGIEVAMDAEASHPDVLVADGLEIGSNRVRSNRDTGDGPSSRVHAVDFQVRDVKTQVEVLGHVPLRAGANPPAGPVVVAAHTRSCENANARSSTAAAVNTRALQRAKDGIGLAVIAHRRIAAVERRPPPRVPEVLIARVDAPRRGQINAGACVVEGAAGSKKVGTAIDAIGEDAVGGVKTMLHPPVVVRIKEDIALRTLGVDGLQLQVVARADKRRIQAQASHGCPAPFVVGVTT